MVQEDPFTDASIGNGLVKGHLFLGTTTLLLLLLLGGGVGVGFLWVIIITHISNQIRRVFLGFWGGEKGHE